MRAIVVLFDTLNRRYLPPYGATDVHAPQFGRLAEAAVTFDNCYAGSMPCMPARRELHTGRHNFLHRSWGPLEPFDDSVPELLSRNGVHTHLATDHQHYWEDGGATYHNRFDTYEFFRGQEGDRWKGQVADPEMPDTEVVGRRASAMVRQHWVNRPHFLEPGQHPQTRTVDAGLEFLDTNAAEQEWFLQIECFDPHEPFLAIEEHRARYDLDEDGGRYDWPGYRKVTEGPAVTRRVRDEYRALLSMCDASLGRVLDAMDRHALWEDTLLVVCTDHGLLLGEHGWWGKNVQPWYDENIHTPLFVWDPREAARGERRDALVQTVDIGPTLLDFFGVPRTPDMQGIPLTGPAAGTRAAALFGAFGSHVNVTDGRFVYLRAPATAANEPLFEHTLMPTHMNSRFTPDELRGAELVPPLPFTKGVPVLRLPGHAWGNPHAFGTLLFDLETDPGQRDPLVDDDLELTMATHLVELMRASDAPVSQFERLGLPAEGPVSAEHLLVRAQREMALAALEDLPSSREFSAALRTPIGELLADPEARDVLLRHLPLLANTDFAAATASESVWTLAATTPSLTAQALRALDAELNRLATETSS
ncbi:sulfatase [Amycolatopsis rhabdoformis]|uniref:Sulfatase n=1 Tax=Amycolatopsis rhabdoformis TaxID=1448059 RepID=A0ABZ1IKI3_9PSEU|nr:sulfatase [Amycolatopsis rhabdoformis]WSE34247.1 sulfatase [Amycolatopsis rhabdoformis]